MIDISSDWLKGFPTTTLHHESNLWNMRSANKNISPNSPLEFVSWQTKTTLSPSEVHAIAYYRFLLMQDKTALSCSSQFQCRSWRRTKNGHPSSKTVSEPQMPWQPLKRVTSITFHTALHRWPVNCKDFISNCNSIFMVWINLHPISPKHFISLVVWITSEIRILSICVALWYWLAV